MTNLFLVCEARHWTSCLCYGYSLMSVPASCLSVIFSSFSSLSLSTDVYFSLFQVNGVNIEGLRHSEVVALIRAGGEEVRLLVVDPETDELFLRLGLTPTTSHDKGKITHTHTAYLPIKCITCFCLLCHRGLCGCIGH